MGTSSWGTSMKVASWLAKAASCSRAASSSVCTAVFRANTVDVLQGPLSGVLTTAQLSLIQDDGVRAALNQWLAIANNLGDWNQRLTGLAEGGMVAIGHHEVFRDVWVNGVQALPPTVDLKAVRDDDEVMALAAAVVRSRGIQRTFTEGLLDSLDELGRLLEPLLAGRS